MKLPFFNFYPNDWLRDTRSLSPESKGAWIDILCLAWNEENRGIYKRWPDMMQRELGILDRAQLDHILSELDGVANIEQNCECDIPNGLTHQPNDECNGIITVTSRRMVKLEKDYKINANRQRKHYRKHQPNANLTATSRQPNENLTDKTSDVRRHQRLTANVSAAQPPPLLAASSATRESEKTWRDLPDSERMTPEDFLKAKEEILRAKLKARRSHGQEK